MEGGHGRNGWGHPYMGGEVLSLFKFKQTQTIQSVYRPKCFDSISVKKDVLTITIYINNSNELSIHDNQYESSAW